MPGVLDDLKKALEWLGEAADRIADWAGTEQGQQALAGGDLMLVMVKVSAFFERSGWYLPLAPSLYRYALESQREHIPFDPRVPARLVGPESAFWPMIRNGLTASPVLSSRRPVLEDGLACIEQHRWHGAISTLLPLIEGIVGDKTAVLEKMRVPRRLEKYLHREDAEVEEVLGLVAVPALVVLDSEVFARREFGAVEIDDQALNRNIVLHGRSAGFGSEVNALRTLMIIVALAELFDGPIAERAPVPEEFYEPDLLEEFGPLSNIRAAARGRTALKQPPALNPGTPDAQAPGD